MAEVALGGRTAEVRAADHPQLIEARLVAEEPIVIEGNSFTFRRLSDVVELVRQRDVVGIVGAMGKDSGGSMGGERPLLPLDLDGPEHRKYRRLLDPLFSAKQLAPLEPAMRQLMRDLLDRFHGNGGAELYQSLCVPLPSTVFLQMLGMPLTQADDLIDFVDATLHPVGETPEEDAAHLRIAADRTYRYIEEEMDRRVSAGVLGEDLLGHMMTTEVEGEKLTRLEILDITYLLVIAGLDTITSSLSCMLLWLAEHPDERHWILEDPDARWGPAIEELLRWFSPALFGKRWAAKDLVVAGVEVPAGAELFAVASCANLDADIFEDPLTIDLTRSPNRHIAFASGPHRCLGSHLTRLELRVALDEFHRRIPDYEVTAGETPIRDNAGVRRVKYLPLTWS